MSVNQQLLSSAASTGRSVPTQADGDQVSGRSIRYDVLAILTCVLIAALYVLLVPALRTSSAIGGTAPSLDSLRKVLTVVLGFLALAVFIGEREYVQVRPTSMVGQTTRYVAGIVLGVYVLYAALFTFFGATFTSSVASFAFLGIEGLTDGALPTIAEYAALLSVIVLWQPWGRVPVYQKAGRKLLPALVVAVSVLAIWQLIVQAFDIKQFLLPAPIQIGTTFFNIYPRLIAQGWITFQNALWGFTFGCGAGILTGLVSARFGGFSRAIMPYAIAANSIPIIAFAPITNNWFGLLNPLSKIAVVSILTYFPAMINTLRGLTLADPSALALMRSYAATEREIFLKVRLPMALPYIFNGLKIGCTLSMIGAIVAEYFGGPTTGLGVNIMADADLIRYPNVWSEIIVASALGIGFYFVVLLIERLVMPWHISFRTETD
ncbi:MAG: ABC transporter permease [Aggregatilineales bacterium]